MDERVSTSDNNKMTNIFNCTATVIVIHNTASLWVWVLLSYIIDEGDSFESKDIKFH